MTSKKRGAPLSTTIPYSELARIGRENPVDTEGNDCWSTPPHVLAWILQATKCERVWFDPCGNPQNTAGAYVTLDAASARPPCLWPAPPDGSLVYQNHPYSNNKHWAMAALYYVTKYSHYAPKVPKVPFHYVVLANNSSGTEWFSKLTALADGFVCLHKRVAFLNPETREPFQGNNYGTCIWYFGPDAQGFVDRMAHVGVGFTAPAKKQFRITGTGE